jgi:hypothetical protein
MDIEELARVIPKHYTDWDNASVLIWLEYIHLPHLVIAFGKHRNIQKASALKAATCSS